MTPEQKREYMRRWWAAHPDYKRLYRLRNRDWLNAQGRELRRRERQQFPEKVRARKRAAYHRALDASRDMQLTDTHREAARRWKRDHREENRASHTAGSNRRRVRKLGAGGSHTLREWKEKCELFAHCCAYCGEAKPLARDHNIPISRGGTDDIMNIVPACHQCNSAKNNRTAAEFLVWSRR